MKLLIKSGLYGMYKDEEYEITIDMDDNVKIMTEDKSKIDHTFVDTYKSGLFTKIVNPTELVNCISIVTYGIIQGEKVQVLKEKENDYQVSTNSLLVASNLNLPRVDRDTWIGWISKSKVKLIEEKTSINPLDL
ncbi:hypothetical protein LC087_18200 [Bacillus carboniphilus]|uniref:YopX protein domain-containing protein n=1 Tax=Bacillus carboniphilus TaxID=86663 RepID=A0ABY9JWD7_9BACI|nr:hypothetical protein [Bacillus carboniphilus]WLR42588.1 hypothetical protein LC087_18200 [Bacillus carboniphilus]